jgi:hypothetical protein
MAEAKNNKKEKRERGRKKERAQEQPNNFSQ